MKPKALVRQAQRELFRVELEHLVDASHPLVKLGRQIEWAVFAECLGQTYAVANQPNPMSKKSRLHSAQFKTQVRLETLKGIEPVHAIADRHGVHPS